MLGKKRWMIAEGYIPDPGPHGDDPALRSHETASVLNAGKQPARLKVMVYFSDKEPAGPFNFELAPERTLHLRFDEFEDPQPIPRNTDYASVIESDVPVVVQHTRLDARLGSLALLSTTAYSED